MKKALSIILAFIMLSGLFTVLPAAGSAAVTNVAETGTLYVGTTGDCSWTFEDTDGTLTVNGSGSTGNYSRSTPDYFSQFRYKIKKIVICDGVTEIGVSAFSGLPNLESVSIPPSVTTICNDAFGDISLKRVDISDLRAWLKISFGSTSRVFYSSKCGLYLNNQLLTKLTVPQGITYIPSYAFQGYCKLESVATPSSVTYIGKCAFQWCHGLKSVSFGGGVTINESAFWDCPALQSVSFAKSGTTDIGAKAFLSCISLQSLNLPGNVKWIGEEAFSSCKSLTSVTMNYGLISIGEKAFWSCESLKSIVIPDSVTSGIKVGTFQYCYSLESAVIGNRVPSIAGSSFSYCRNLKELTIGSSVETIYYRACTSCTNLYYVVIPPTVKKIYDEAFGYYYDSNYGMSQNALFIYGDKGSEAERYAKKYGFPFMNRSLAPGSATVSLKTPVIRKIENVKNGTKLTWNKVSGAKKFRVYVKSGSSWKKLGDTTGVSYLNKNVSAGKKYAYAVRAFSSGGKTYSKLSAVKSYIFIKAPVITKLTNTASGTKLTWGKCAGAVNYKVFIKSGSSWKTLGTTAGTSFVHKNAVSGKGYTYTVRCVSAGGGNAHSAYNTAGWYHKYVKPSSGSSQPAANKFSAPKITKLQLTPIGIRVYWSNVKAARYRVFIKSGGKWKKLRDTAKTSFYHYTLTSGKTYAYTVRCLSADGKAYTSGCYKAGKSVQYLAQPTISPLTNTASGIRIDWKKVSGAVKYRVFTKVGSSWRKLADTASTSYTHNGLTNLTVHSYTVACLSADGTKLTSSYHANGRSRTFKATPQITSITRENDGYHVRWKAVPGVTMYRLYFSKYPDAGQSSDTREWGYIEDTTETNGVIPDYFDAYYFSVRGVSEDGKTFLTYRNNVGWRYPFP